MLERADETRARPGPLSRAEMHATPAPPLREDDFQRPVDQHIPPHHVEPRRLEPGSLEERVQADRELTDAIEKAERDAGIIANEPSF